MQLAVLAVSQLGQEGRCHVSQDIAFFGKCQIDILRVRGVALELESLRH
jgi:hypothetical protein